MSIKKETVVSVISRLVIIMSSSIFWSLSYACESCLSSFKQDCDRISCPEGWGVIVEGDKSKNND